MNAQRSHQKEKGAQLCFQGCSKAIDTNLESIHRNINIFTSTFAITLIWIHYFMFNVLYCFRCDRFEYERGKLIENYV